MTEQAEQLALVPPEPRKRTERQQFVLDAVRAGGIDGVDADQAGALLCERRGRHGRDDRCFYDGLNGLGVLRELEAKGLVRYRRRKGSTPGAWIATGEIPDDGRLPRGMTAEIPY